jgi:hypothetical protein
VAAQDLGGLGAQNGPPVSFTWTPPSRVPYFLPLLIPLLLLLLKPNRTLQAWWVVLPLAFSMAVASMIWIFPVFGADTGDDFFPILSTMAVGLAAVWLLSPYLKTNNRWLLFLGILWIMESAGIFTLAVHGSWQEGKELVILAVRLVWPGVVIAAAITLAGRNCRSQARLPRLLWWLLLWITAAWAAVFVVMSLSQGPGPWLEMAIALVIISAITGALLLPFLMFSWGHRSLRERLNQLLGWQDEVSLENTLRPANPSR